MRILRIKLDSPAVHLLRTVKVLADIFKQVAQVDMRTTLVGEIAPEIPLLAIPAIPGLVAVRMVRNSSRNSKFAIPGT